MNLRKLFLLNAVVFGLLGLGLALALIFFTDQMRISADRMETAIHSVHAAEKLQIALLSYDREVQYNIPEVENTKTIIFQSIEEMQTNIDTTEELNLFKDVVTNIKTYLAGHPSNRRVNLIVADESLNKLVNINIQQSTKLQDEIQKSQRTSDLVGMGCLALLFITGFFITVLHRRNVSQPLIILHETLRRFSLAPFSSVKMHIHGVSEIEEIARAIQQMSDSLIRQRESQFKVLAAIAHDLRNPLNGIQMSTDLLTESDDPEERAAVVDIVKRQAIHLERLVGDLLDTTRIEAGDILLKPEKMDLRNPVREAMTLFKSTSEKHELQLVVPEEAVVCNCDPVRISQVLNNLLSNAIKYSPNGGRVEIALEIQQSYAVIKVSDSGIGIAEADLSTIFEPFHRTSVTRDAFPGVGLGLSAARKIIESHQGKIEIQSEPGHGTCFQVFLPLAQAE